MASIRTSIGSRRSRPGRRAGRSSSGWSAIDAAGVERHPPARGRAPWCRSMVAVVVRRVDVVQLVVADFGHVRRHRGEVLEVLRRVGLLELPDANPARRPSSPERGPRSIETHGGSVPDALRKHRRVLHVHRPCRRAGARPRCRALVRPARPATSSREQRTHRPSSSACRRSRSRSSPTSVISRVGVTRNRHRHLHRDARAAPCPSSSRGVDDAVPVTTLVGALAVAASMPSSGGRAARGACRTRRSRDHRPRRRQPCSIPQPDDTHGRDPPTSDHPHEFGIGRERGAPEGAPSNCS